MSRYLGPKFKKSRKLKMSLLENNREFTMWKKRITPPGQHGNARQKKLSNYGRQLFEKQKLKNLYNITEKQLKIAWNNASNLKGVVGVNLLLFLELRLDNIIFRLNIAPTRSAARQLVAHKHILVNGKVINIPSYRIKVNDKIALSNKMQKNKIILDNLNEKKSTLDFIELNKEKFFGFLKRMPRRDELSNDIHESYIVELFSR